MQASYQVASPIHSADPARKKWGYRWERIVERVSALPLNSAEVVAFRLTIDRLRRDLGVGRSHCSEVVCPHCVSEILDAYPGSEEELVLHYDNCLNEVKHALDALAVA